MRYREGIADVAHVMAGVAIGLAAGTMLIQSLRGPPDVDTRPTGGGLFKITDVSWKHYAPMADIDLARCPNALSCDASSQSRVAGLMWHCMNDGEQEGE